MYDHRLYLKTLSEFTRILLTPYDVHAVLRELADRVTGVLGLLGSGVGLAEGEVMKFDSGVGSQVAELERLQERTQLGPCVAALRSGARISVPDLRDEAERWPEYCRAAVAMGVSAVASIPMRLGEQTVGALNLYSREPREWTDGDMAAAVVMADIATAYLINASKHRQQVELAAQLQHALDSRLVIEQAKGMLAATHNISPGDAFDRLRHHARNHGVTVHAVADAVVNLGMDV